MKKIIYLILGILLSCQLFANNLIIGTPVYSGSENTLTFTIKWDNSWRVNSGPTNYDAVWLFVKRQPCGANGIWSHALLSSTAGAHVVSGTNANGLVIDAVTDKMGVFVHLGLNASNQIISSLTTTTIVLKLTEEYNPTLSGTSSAAADNWKVFGFEMVYVPTGEFSLGDGRSSNSSNFSAGSTTQPVRITNALQNVTGLGSYSNYTSSIVYASPIALPTTFPIGYNGFYCMKYEILQGQMVDFYNTLTYDQQAARLKISSNRVLTSTNQYYGENWGSISLYNSSTGTNNTIPATITSAYPHLPMGYMNWQDLTSYLDWSGLRPMTEFEFEKACRGTLLPVAYEYPWGTTIMNGGNGGNYIYAQWGATATWPVYDGACRNWDDQGPVRSGFAATTTSNRSQSGATYYGIMEMAGNVWEQCVGGGNGYDYSTFTTTNGDGILTTAGLANVTGWPPNGGTTSGTILKGGHFVSTSNYFQYQISDRAYYGGSGENASNTRTRYIGGRGVRGN
jgi:formylglycine-generating enzyme required for sulfatase activity